MNEDERDIQTELSVLLICYNGERYLRECLDSVSAQTLRNFRLIFIDDGSEDGTKNVYEAWKKENGRDDLDCVYSRIIHSGQAAACREGLNYLTGDVFTWADVDDVLLPEALEEYCRYFQSHKERSMVRANAFLMDEKLETVLSMAFEEPHRKELSGMAAGLITGELTSQGSGIYAMRTQLIKEIYKDTKFPLSIAGQNLQLLIPALSRTDCGFIDRPLYLYRIRPDSDSHQRRSLSMLLGRIEAVYELLLTLAPLCGNREEEIKILAAHYRKKERALAMKQAADRARIRSRR